MNQELDVVSEQLLHQLNDVISKIQIQEQTLENEIKNFQNLHDLYYDIRYARVSNRSSMNPSIKIKRELKAIYGYLMITLKQMHDRQRKILSYIYNEQMTEELKRPLIITPLKSKLKTYFSRTTLLIQRIEILFE